MILMYHKISTDTPTMWWVSADQFDKQMSDLSAYEVVHLANYDPNNEKHVVITFDGVYENVFQYAFPILKKWNYPFELFVVGDLIGKDNTFDTVEPPAKFATMDQLQIMSESGGRIQWHTAAHSVLKQLPRKDIVHELTIPDTIKSIFSSPHFDWFAYPHGEHDDETVNEVRRRFLGAVSCIDGNNHDKYLLNRKTVLEDTQFSKSKVSVIIANYNYGRFLNEAVDSVLKQTISADEIILIDDCSTDGSQEIANLYQEKLKIVLNEENLGIVDNFNKAVRLSTGDYVCILGADNLMRSDYIEKCKAALDKQENAACAYTDMTIFGALAPKLAEEVQATYLFDTHIENCSVYLWEFTDPTEEALANLENLNFIHGSSMYRRFVFDKIGGYVKTDGPEDHNLFMRMIDAGWGVTHVKFPLIKYRQHSITQANSVLNLQLSEAKLREKHSQISNERDSLLSERDSLLSEYHLIINSISWKITRPFRYLKRLIKLFISKIVASLIRNKSFIPKPFYKLLKIIYNAKYYLNGIDIQNINNTSYINYYNSQRRLFTNDDLLIFNRFSEIREYPPDIDLSVVTYNSQKWIDGFIKSLLNIEYPKNKLHIYIVDNNSTDKTLEAINSNIHLLRQAGFTVSLQQQPNNGFGAGHNAAIALGSSPYCLITNVDLTFDPKAIKNIASLAESDDADVATWELRQKPYEHPKFYDPVSLLTDWNSHASCLIKRSAFEEVGGYDENLFMYGEDVELSYRLRQSGFKLRYCPTSVAWHFTYESAGQVKPLQYLGSIFSNFYLRLLYGRWSEIIQIPLFQAAFLVRQPAFKGARKALLKDYIRLALNAPKAILKRKRRNTHFPFSGMDYSPTRYGAFLEYKEIDDSVPLITVITRTYKGREFYLKQAILSVANQTWPNIEHIIVQDGDKTMEKFINEISENTKSNIEYHSTKKLGRSAAGNKGLSVAHGKWILFLDDDDLLYADHCEVLATALLGDPTLAAAYSLAWEVPTDINDSEDGYNEREYKLHAHYQQPFDRNILKQRNFIPIQSILFEKSLYELNGGFNEQLDLLEDWNLWYRYSVKDSKFLYIPKITSLYRVPANPKTMIERQEKFNLAYYDVYKENSQYD